MLSSAKALGGARFKSAGTMTHMTHKLKTQSLLLFPRESL